ncbi:hypothetical protein NW759_014888 [Fusarium solani]|nr:hypothetical protein NW759_014888 [Fusarium solani]
MNVISIATGYYQDCLAYALEFDIWKIYGNGVSSAASACGLSATPSPSGAGGGAGSTAPPSSSSPSTSAVASGSESGTGAASTSTGTTAATDASSTGPPSGPTTTPPPGTGSGGAVTAPPPTSTPATAGAPMAEVRTVVPMLCVGVLTGVCRTDGFAMALPQVEFELPHIPPLLDEPNANDFYENWKWAVLFHLDWYGLRPFIEGTVEMASSEATEEEQLAYNRRKMMAYWILRNSLYDDAWFIIRDSDNSPYDMDFNYDDTYDAKLLRGMIHLPAIFERIMECDYD